MQAREIPPARQAHEDGAPGQTETKRDRGKIGVKRIAALSLLLVLSLSLSGCAKRPAAPPAPSSAAPTLPPETEAPKTEPPVSETPSDPALLFPAFFQPGRLLLAGGGSVPVELLSAESGVSYRIRYPSGSEATVAWDKIEPLAPTVPDLPPPTGDEVIAYLKSELGDPLPAFVLFVDLSRLTVTAAENGEVIRVMPCTVGDAGHPTPRGRFETDYRTEYMGKEGAYLCRWGVHYFGGYLFHSVLYTWRGDTILDGELSARLSHGCVRLSPENSRWIYETAPLGAVVWVN